MSASDSGHPPAREEPPGEPERSEQQVQQRRALKAMLFPTYFVVAFAFCYISAFHAPSPHGVKVAIVGPSAQTAMLRASVQKAAGSSFDIRTASTSAEAARQVRSGRLNAAYVPAVGTNGSATAIVASAAGSSLASADESLFRTLSAQQGAQLVVQDTRPLPSGDPGGTATFYFVIICTLGGYLTVTILGQAAPALEPRRRYPLIAAAAISTPILVLLIGGLILGAFSGSAAVILAMIGLGALYSLIIGVIARLLQVLLGSYAIYAMMATFVFLNFPSSGGAIPAQLLPGFWHFLNRFWIGAPAVNAIRSVLYFGGQGVGDDVIKLLAWLVIVVGLLVQPISRKLERERQTKDVGPIERAAAQSPA